MGNKVYDFKLTNKELREELDKSQQVIANLKKQDLETRVSLYNVLQKLSQIGHSNDTYKVINMTDLIDKTIEEMWEDLKIDLYVENDEEGKIIELPTTDQSVR